MKRLNCVFVFAHCILSPLAFAISKQERYTPPENKALNMPFSEAVRVGNTLYLSGQIGSLPGQEAVVPGGILPETEQAMKNMQAVLKHFHASFKNVVKCQVFLADISEWAQFNSVYTKFFTPPYPARSAFGASGLAAHARVELECIAILPHTPHK